MWFIFALILGGFASVISAQEAKCSTLHLIYGIFFVVQKQTSLRTTVARVTTEPPTNVEHATAQQFESAAARVATKGFGAAGFSLVTELTKLIPDATTYPVNYPVCQQYQISTPNHD
jgi:hypothetical protein